MTGRVLVGSGLLAALLAGVLAGCSSDEENYCDAVKQHQVELGKISAEGGPDALLRELPTLESLAADAPTDIKDEWQTVITAVKALDRAFDDAGVDPATYDAKHPPADLSDADRQTLESAASDLAGESVSAATRGIEQEALDICKTPIGL